MKIFLTTKYGLWIDTRSSTDNKLHGSGRAVNSGIKLQIDKVSETAGNLTCYIFALQDAYVHGSKILVVILVASLVLLVVILVPASSNPGTCIVYI